MKFARYEHLSDGSAVAVFTLDIPSTYYLYGHGGPIAVQRSEAVFNKSSLMTRIANAEKAGASADMEKKVLADWPGKK